MGKIYLNEIKEQLALINKKLAETEPPRNGLGQPLIKMAPELVEKRKAWRQRKNELEEQIISYRG